MSDYFDRLAGKNLGSLPLAQPVLAPSFAPSPLQDTVPPLETFDPLALETTQEPEASSPAVRAARRPGNTETPAAPPLLTVRNTPPVKPSSIEMEEAQDALPEQTTQQIIAPRLVSGHETRSSSIAVDLPFEDFQPLAPKEQEGQQSQGAPDQLPPAADQPPAPDQPAQSAPFRPQLVDARSQQPQPEPQAQPLLVQSENAQRIADALEPMQTDAADAPLAATPSAPGAPTSETIPEAAPPQTVVKITIGRIDVRASSPPTANTPAASTNSRPAPAVTLDQYLKARSEERS